MSGCLRVVLRVVVVTILFYLIPLSSACNAANSGVQNAILQAQARYPQKCMHCPILNYGCDPHSLSTGFTCGKSDLFYEMIYRGVQNCGQAVLYCYASPSQQVGSNVSVGIERFTYVRSSTSSSKIFAPLAADAAEENVFYVDGSGDCGELAADAPIYCDESTETTTPISQDVPVGGSPYIYLLQSKPERLIVITLNCNDDAQWEAADTAGNTLAGFDQLYCLNGPVY